MCKGTCLSNGLFQRPCMGKAVRLLQLLLLPLRELSRITSAERVVPLSAFYICPAEHTGSPGSGWPGGHLLSRIESQGLQSLLRPSVCLCASGMTGVPSERRSVCGCCLFCKLQFIPIWESRDWKWRSCLAGTICSGCQWHQKDPDLTSKRAAVFWDEDFNLPSCFGE